jgi:predicted Zn-dependent peptidase
MTETPKKLAAVTAEDVRWVARKYLTPENQAVYLVSRKGSGAAPAVEVKK